MSKITDRLFDNAYLETADVQGSLPPLELHKGKDAVVEYASQHNISRASSEQLYSTIVNAPKWLPYSSSIYHTSANVKDYFTVPTIIMPTDLPNRNGTAFPLTELAKFDPEIGNHAYMGWIGKPVYIEHDNLDYTKAIGAVVDVAMRKIDNANGGLYKVIALMAIDRTKNPKIANDILSGRRRNYSMGAMVKAYQCSICGAKGFIRSGLRNKFEALACGTQHAAFDRQGKFRTVPLTANSQERTLGFLNAIGVKPFEISTVGYPAFASAYTPEYRIANM